ncbi:MFS transporter [Nocardia asteroides]|uniref:MFS transporter n=1 Tax=Nocardia asteroides TaxID=1824 RepID=UPI001E49663D|nr:MFS transporter [Nocardia asteroides]UGT62626.1 MFS transporter [Nocardia asteroides]
MRMVPPVPDWFRPAFAMFCVGWGANQFTPLALVYENETGISDATFAALFGIYAAGLIPALFLTGWLAGGPGRRPVLLWTLAVSIVATIVLMVDPGQIGLLALGRLLAGVASGAAFVAGGAWVKELSAAAPAGAGARRAAIALSGGFGAGPLVSGAIAQWAPLPMVLAYGPHLVLMAVALVLVRGCPEGAPAAVPGTRRWNPLPAPVRTRAFLIGVAPWAPWVFGAATVSFVTVAKLVSGRVPGWGVVFSGAVAGLTLLTGVVVQPFARRLGAGGYRLPVLGLLLTVLGFGSAALIAGMPGSGLQLLLVVPTAVTLGSAYGFLLVAGLLAVERLAAPDELAGLIAVFYALIYLGFTAPYLLAALSGGAGSPVWLLVAAGLALLTIPAASTRSAEGRTHAPADRGGGTPVRSAGPTAGGPPR